MPNQTPHHSLESLQSLDYNAIITLRVILGTWVAVHRPTRINRYSHWSGPVKLWFIKLWTYEGWSVKPAGLNKFGTRLPIYKIKNL